MYRTIDTAIWNDPKVLALTPNGKLLFVYLITNHHAHVAGIYYLPALYVQHELKLSSETVDTLWDTLSDAGLCLRDRANDVIWVKKMLRRQGRGKKIRQAAANQLSSLHNSMLINDFLNEYPDVKRLCKDTLSHTPSAGRIQEQEQEQEQEKNTPRADARDPQALNGKSPQAERPEKSDTPTAAAPKPRQKSEPTGPHAQAVKHFCDSWKSVYGTDYAFNGGKDGDHVKKILAHVGGDVDRFKAATATYLANRDPFVANDRHGLGLFLSQLRKFVTTSPKPRVAEAVANREDR